MESHMGTHTETHRLPLAVGPKGRGEGLLPAALYSTPCGTAVPEDLAQDRGGAWRIQSSILGSPPVSNTTNLLETGATPG